MTTQTTADVIDRVRLLMLDMPAGNAALKFEAETILRDMEREGAQELDAISIAALKVFAKKLNVSASWLIEGKPGKAAAFIIAEVDAIRKKRGALSSREDVLLRKEDFDRVFEVAERLPDAAAA